MSTKTIWVSDGKNAVPVNFYNLPNANTKEAENYLEYVKAHKSENSPPVAVIDVRMCDDGKVDVEYVAKGEKFERIRRITGK